MVRPSPEVQGNNLAELVAGTFMEWMKVRFAPQFLEGDTVFERTGVSKFTVTTRSGTVLECNMKVLEPGS